MIVAASTTLLADSRSGRNAGVLPWALLVAGSVASLAANVALAEPSPDWEGYRGMAVIRAHGIIRVAERADRPSCGASQPRRQAAGAALD